VDWFSASLENYSGGLWNTQVGINWQAFRNIGIGLYYNDFFLDVDVDKNDFRGRFESGQYGPFLALTASW
jgi:hypothetical protein